MENAFPNLFAIWCEMTRVNNIHTWEGHLAWNDE